MSQTGSDVGDAVLMVSMSAAYLTANGLAKAVPAIIEKIKDAPTVQSVKSFAKSNVALDNIPLEKDYLNSFIKECSKIGVKIAVTDDPANSNSVNIIFRSGQTSLVELALANCRNSNFQEKDAGIGAEPEANKTLELDTSKQLELGSNKPLELPASQESSMIKVETSHDLAEPTPIIGQTKSTAKSAFDNVPFKKSEVKPFIDECNKMNVQVDIRKDPVDPKFVAIYFRADQMETIEKALKNFHEKNLSNVGKKSIQKRIVEAVRKAQEQPVQEQGLSRAVRQVGAR